MNWVGGSTGVESAVVSRKCGYQKFKEGGFARGALRKLWVFSFVHHTKGAQNCRKFVANLKVIFGQFLCKYPFSNAPILEIAEFGTLGEFPKDLLAPN